MSGLVVKGAMCAVTIVATLTVTVGVVPSTANGLSSQIPPGATPLSPLSERPVSIATGGRVSSVGRFGVSFNKRQAVPGQPVKLLVSGLPKGVKKVSVLERGSTKWRRINSKSTSRKTLSFRLNAPSGTRNYRVSVVRTGQHLKKDTKLVVSLVAKGQAEQGNATQAGVGASGNPFDYGQCTYHGYETRSDIYEAAVAAGVPRGGRASSAVYGGIPDYWWNGWRWADNAKRGGFQVGNSPSVGALAVYPRGWGGSAVGHVAYVVEVLSDGRYRTSDRNVNGSSSITQHVRYPTQGVQFVYGGPSGSGPGPSSPGTPPTQPGGPPPGSTRQGMAPSTSPATATSAYGSWSGAWRVAFQANNNNLYVYDSTHGPSNQGQGMMPGTSPSIAALPSGGFEIAFQANTGELIVFGDGPRMNTRQGMAPGTSPSIAVAPSGAWRVAFQANNNNLYVYDSTHGPSNQGQGMMPGTSPSIAALPSGGFEIAFQANTGEMVYWGDGAKANTRQGLLAKSSPAISVAPNGAYRSAFQANTGYLYTWS